MSNKTELYKAILEYVFDMRPEIKILFVKKYWAGSIYFADLKEYLINKDLLDGKGLKGDELIKHLRKNNLGMDEEYTIDELIMELTKDQTNRRK